MGICWMVYQLNLAIATVMKPNYEVSYMALGLHGRGHRLVRDELDSSNMFQWVTDGSESQVGFPLPLSENKK